MLLPFQITVCGFGELAGYQNARVSHVLSLLDPGAAAPDDLAPFPPHQRLELRFNDIIDEQPEKLLPQTTHIEQLLQFVGQLNQANTCMHLLVHCHAGFSRSPASAVLIMATLRPDVPAAEIVDELLRLRPRMWPNFRVIEVGDSLLARGGELVDAARRLYGILLRQDPSLYQLMADAGRQRELDLAISA